MNVDSETAGIFIAIGFLAMGLVSIPVARWFVLGCFALGVMFAVLLRFAPRRVVRPILAVVIVLGIVAVLWSLRRVPQRPPSLSSNAIYIWPNNVPLKSVHNGYWMDCWFDQQENDDRCRLTDKNGNRVFEDVYVTCGIQATIPQSELVVEPDTGQRWIQLRKETTNLPVVFVRYGQILVPRSLYAEARQQGYCYGT